MMLFQNNLAWHPPGTPQYPVAPITAFSTHASTGQWRLNGSVNTREYNTSNTDVKTRLLTTIGREMSAPTVGGGCGVYICLGRRQGSATSPATARRLTLVSVPWWIDGLNRSSTEAQALIPRLAQMTRNRLVLTIAQVFMRIPARHFTPAGGWVNTTQNAWYSSLRVAEGEFATYENVSMAGRVTSIEIVRETAPGQEQVVASLPPSANDYTLTGLASGEYKLSVRCRYENETGTPSGQVTVNI